MPQPAAVFDEKKEAWIQTIPHKEFYRIPEIAAILLTGDVSVRESIKRGTLAGVRVNGVVRVRHVAIVDYLARRGSVVSGDGTMIIEDIIPTKAARNPASIAASLIPAGGGDVEVEDDLAFLDEDD